MTLHLQEKFEVPLYLPGKEEMSRKDFLAFCAANSHLRIERDENKEIIIMPPVFGETGRKHTEILFEIQSWNRQTKLGVTFDSSTGFDLPDGSMRSPDASWVRKEKWEQLSQAERNAFIPFAPDFVVEVISSADNLPKVQLKMSKWIENGTRLGWLIDPKNETVSIYKQHSAIDEVTSFSTTLSGEDVLPGFQFDLNLLT